MQLEEENRCPHFAPTKPMKSTIRPSAASKPRTTGDNPSVGRLGGGGDGDEIITSNLHQNSPSNRSHLDPIAIGKKNAVAIAITKNHRRTIRIDPQAVDPLLSTGEKGPHRRGVGGGEGERGKAPPPSAPRRCAGGGPRSGCGRTPGSGTSRPRASQGGAPADGGGPPTATVTGG